MTLSEQVDNIRTNFQEGAKMLLKQAFVPSAPPAQPAMAQPMPGAPMDPAAMQGGMPTPPPGDPSMMGGAPPMDPAMMQGGQPMPPDAAMMGEAPPMDPGAMQAAPGQGAVPPELEQMLTQLSSGMGEFSQALTALKAQNDQNNNRMLALEESISKLQEAINGPAPFEGSTKTPEDLNPTPTENSNFPM